MDSLTLKNKTKKTTGFDTVETVWKVIGSSLTVEKKKKKKNDTQRNHQVEQ